MFNTTGVAGDANRSSYAELYKTNMERHQKHPQCIDKMADNCAMQSDFHLEQAEARLCAQEDGSLGITVHAETCSVVRCF